MVSVSAHPTDPAIIVESHTRRNLGDSNVSISIVSHTFVRTICDSCLHDVDFSLSGSLSVRLLLPPSR